MGAFSKSVRLRICRIWYRLASRPKRLRTIATSTYPDRGWKGEDHAPTSQESEFERYAERWVRSVKQECLSKLILFGERPLRRAL
jgi:hypothetical protein